MGKVRRVRGFDGFDGCWFHGCDRFGGFNQSLAAPVEEPPNP